MRAQDHRVGVLAQLALVVAQARAVGRADLDERHPGLGDDLGDPERPADLDELAAADDRRAAERGHGEQDGRRAVVDGEGGLGAGQLA